MVVVGGDQYSDKPPKSPSMKAPADPVFERAVSRQPLAVSFFRAWLSAENHIAQVTDLLREGVLCSLSKGQAILSQWEMILKRFFFHSSRLAPGIIFQLLSLSNLASAPFLLQV